MKEWLTSLIFRDIKIKAKNEITKKIFAYLIDKKQLHLLNVHRRQEISPQQGW